MRYQNTSAHPDGAAGVMKVAVGTRKGSGMVRPPSGAVGQLWGGWRAGERKSTNKR